MPSVPFMDRIREAVLIGDGGIGSYLHAQGMPLDSSFEAANLSNPALVRRVHADYIAAGARVIETNTFGANRTKLAASQLEDRVAAINAAGVRLAREVAGEEIYVLGSVGPLGKGRPDADEDVASLFGEQLEALIEAGVDAVVLETFSELGELLAALRVAKSLSPTPVIAQMAFYGRGRTSGGEDVHRVVRALEDAGADVIGGNCGPSGPLELSRILRSMAGMTDRPLSAFPNASYARYVDGRFLYTNNASYFGELAVEMVDAGVALIGGCCGTTPEHVWEMSRRLDGRRPTERHAIATPEPEPSPRKRAKRSDSGSDRPANFLEASPHRIRIIVEVDPPRGMQFRKPIRVSQELRELGADAVSIAENQLASVRMSSFALSHLIQRDAGTTAICHLTCRDRNLIGQQSHLMGASALGIRHILAVTGDPVSLDGTGGSSVFDTNSFGLIELMARMNRGENARGEPLGSPTDFVIGGALSPNRARMDAELRRLEKKVSLGATFAMTQPPATPEMVHELREKTRQTDCHIFVGILPLVSHRNAEFLHNEVPGIRLSDEVRERMRSAVDPLAEGVRIAKEAVDVAVDAGFTGIYIIPMLGKYEMASEIVRYIRERHT